MGVNNIGTRNHTISEKNDDHLQVIYKHLLHKVSISPLHMLYDRGGILLTKPY